MSKREKLEARCWLCRSEDCIELARISKKPRAEVDYGIPAEEYRRTLFRCQSCDVFFQVHDLIDEAFYLGAHNQSTYGERFLARYQKVRDLPLGRSDNRERVQRVHAFLEAQGSSQPPRLALDVGTGLCVFLAELKDLGYRTLAVDPDPRAIAHARDVVGVDQGVVGGIFEVPPETQADLISFNKVLEHIQDPVVHLREAGHRLRPEGVCYVELPDGVGASRAGGFVDQEEFYLEHWTVFSEASFHWLAKEAGFEVLELEALKEPSGKFTLCGFLRRS